MSPLFATLIGLRPTAKARPTDVVLAISPLFSMLMGLLTLGVAKIPKLSPPPLAAIDDTDGAVAEPGLYTNAPDNFVIAYGSDIAGIVDADRAVGVSVDPIRAAEEETRVPCENIAVVLDGDGTAGLV
jgi:hypothetical protein